MIKQRHQKAFTMIEVMIAIGILSMVMISVYASWTALLRATKVGQDAAALAQRTRMASRALESALTTAQLFTGNIDYYTFIADTSEDFAYLTFAARLPPDFPGSGMFGDQQLRRVTFGVTVGEDRRTQLVLTQTPLLAIATDAEPYTIVLGKDIQAFALEFWDPQLGEWAMEYLPTNQLPQLVRFTLGMGPDAKRMELSSRVVAIPSMTITPQIQMSSAISQQGGTQFPGGLPPGGMPPGGFPPGGFNPGGKNPGVFSPGGQNPGSFRPGGSGNGGQGPRGNNQNTFRPGGGQGGRSR